MCFLFPIQCVHFVIRAVLNSFLSLRMSNWCRGNGREVYSSGTRSGFQPCYRLPFLSSIKLRDVPQFIEGISE
jgi:hypothetical protein